MFSYQNKPRLSFKNTQMVSGITQIFTFLWSLVQQSLGLVFSSSQCQLVESCEGQRWILACYTIRLRQSEKAPLCTKRVAAQGWKGSTHPQTYTHTHLRPAFINVYKWICARANTHRYTQSAPVLHRRMHTKAHLSGPFHCVSKSKEVCAPPSLFLCMWYPMSVILKQNHSVPTFSSEIMAWAIFTFRQARTHAAFLPLPNEWTRGWAPVAVV